MFTRKTCLASAALAATLVPLTGAQAETDPDDPFTGFYVGVNVGLSRGSFSIGERTVTRPSETVPGDDEGDPPIVIPASPVTLAQESATTGISPVVGGQIGFNFASRSMLFGIEAEANYASGGGTSSIVSVEDLADDSTLPERTLTSDIALDPEFSGSARLRVGLRQQDLVYFVTGGIAAARVETTSTGTTFAPNGEAGIRTVTASDRATHTGFTGGVGALGWFGAGALGSVELRYTDYGSQTHGIAGTVDTPIVATNIGMTAIQLMIRMSYRF
ncbi:MAG: outer membrane beta-barrel protein [Sphingomonadaceae bacterium]|nr:outer membrane beta-barrel protein [Sphingomonadaceae bacterium]